MATNKLKTKALQSEIVVLPSLFSKSASSLQNRIKDSARKLGSRSEGVKPAKPEESKSGLTSFRHWDRFSQDRRGFRSPAKRSQRHDESGLQVECRGTRRPIGRSLPDLRHCSLTVRTQSPVDTNQDHASSTGEDGNARVFTPIGGSKKECGLGTDDCARKALMSARAFHQGPARRDPGSSHCAPSFIRSNDVGLGSSTVARSPSPPRASRPYKSSHCSQVDLNRATTAHAWLRSRRPERDLNSSFYQPASKTYIRRKSMTIPAIASETVDSDAYSFVIAQKYNIDAGQCRVVAPLCCSTRLFPFSSYHRHIPKTQETYHIHNTQFTPSLSGSDSNADLNFSFECQNARVEKNLNEINEYKFDVFRNLELDNAEGHAGLSLPAECSRYDSHLRAHEGTATLAESENFYDNNKRDPAIRTNLSSDPQANQFHQKGVCISSPTKEQNWEHGSGCSSCSSVEEDFSRNARFSTRKEELESVSLPSTLHNLLSPAVAAGRSREGRHSKPVTRSKSNRVCADTIACSTSTTTTATTTTTTSTTTPVAAGGRDRISSLRFSLLRCSATEGDKDEDDLVDRSRSRETERKLHSSVSVHHNNTKAATTPKDKRTICGQTLEKPEAAEPEGDFLLHDTEAWVETAPTLLTYQSKAPENQLHLTRVGTYLSCHDMWSHFISKSENTTAGKKTTAK